MFWALIQKTVKPVLSDHIKQDIFLAFQTGGCLLLHESTWMTTFMGNSSSLILLYILCNLFVILAISCFCLENMNLALIVIFSYQFLVIAYLLLMKYSSKEFFFSFIQFNVPFKIISLIETSQSIGGAKGEYPGKTT